MRTRLELFLKSGEYRRLRLKTFFEWLLGMVLTPYYYISAVIKAQKFKMEHPSRWEQYLWMKEMEQKNERADKLYQIAYNKIQFTGAVMLMSIMMLEYIADYVMEENANDGRCHKKPLDRIQSDFEEHKKEACESMNKLQELCGDFPSEFFVMVESSNYDSYTDMDQVKNFTEILQSFVQDAGLMEE